MKRSLKGINGTSFHGSVIRTSKNKLVEVLGKPNYTNPKTEKVQNEWVCETDFGSVFTIYDYKEYRKYKNSEVIEWHIGGFAKEITEKAKEEIEKLF